ILASASVFAQNVGVNANGSAQVNVQSGGLVKGITGAVANTAQGVGHAAHHVGHAAVNTGVNASKKTVGTAANIGSKVIHTTGTTVKNTKDYAVEKAVDGRTFAADKTSYVKKRIADKQASSKALSLEAQTNAKAQLNNKTA
ncbi:hypothetical protein, partial [Acinetobacter ursingii]|uniref:hypothetical protein n=1 Tax=Acinetobacter ursingii TaxID=108980 RepID=UPI00124DA52B